MSNEAQASREELESLKHCLSADRMSKFRQRRIEGLCVNQCFHLAEGSPQVTACGSCDCGIEADSVKNRFDIRSGRVLRQVWPPLLGSAPTMCVADCFVERIHRIPPLPGDRGGTKRLSTITSNCGLSELPAAPPNGIGHRVCSLRCRRSTEGAPGGIETQSRHTGGEGLGQRAVASGGGRQDRRGDGTADPVVSTLDCGGTKARADVTRRSRFGHFEEVSKGARPAFEIGCQIASDR